MIDLNNPELVKLIRQTALSVSSDYPSYVSPDDTEQNLWEWVLKKRGTVSRLMRESEKWEAALGTTLTKVAHESAQKEESATHGYDDDDVYHYTIPVIRTLLLDAFDYENWQSFQTFGDGQPRGKGQANMTGDRLAMLADVKSAVEKLDDDQYNLIIWHFKYQHSYTRLAEILEISTDASRKRLERALGAVQRLLGKKSMREMRQPDGSRSVTTNANARYVTERDYEG